jgi:hypothetical protein
MGLRPKPISMFSLKLVISDVISRYFAFEKCIFCLRGIAREYITDWCINFHITFEKFKDEISGY